MLLPTHYTEVVNSGGGGNIMALTPAITKHGNNICHNLLWLNW